MNRRVFLKGISAVGAASVVCGAGRLRAAAAKDRPNIVWIFSDDHAYQAIGTYGGRLQKLNPTPNIDKLASAGMRFDKSYVGNSICAPSRGTLLTGKHSHLHGMIANGPRFDQGQQTFPKLLQKAGYQTAMIGKIHLPGKMQGFDYWDVLPGQGDYYQPQFLGSKGNHMVPGYVSDIITDKSLGWLEADRDKSKPFMLMIHHKAPHRNWLPATRHVGKYEDVEIPEPDNLFDDYATRGVAAKKQTMTIARHLTHFSDLMLVTQQDRDAYAAKAKKAKAAGKKHPFTGGERGAYFRMTDQQRAAWDKIREPSNQKILAKGPKWLSTKEGIKWRYQRYMKDYLGAIAGVDDSVGRVLDYLKKTGMDKNTIVMYSSDQGFYLGEHGWFDKRFMYKESFRTPLIAKWPGVVKPGSTNTDLVQNIDWAETFLDIAGAPIPADMQGCSLVPLLKGKTPANWRKTLYYQYFGRGAHSVRAHEGVADKRYKLMRFMGRDIPKEGQWEFYDIKTDPGEMKNAYSAPEHAERIATMKIELQRLKKQYKVPPGVPG
ncbi:MAG: sulfatase [Phycisphaerales bacterium]|jgi:arylsulfatase A-like enzyme|nr:sulfatase [Phycisphaerales bacterium]